MNKLISTIFIKKPYGSDIIWSLTDNYMSKTIDVAPNKKTPLIVHDIKEKSLIVIKGPLFLEYGRCCDVVNLKTYKIPEGWSFYIEPNFMYRYVAMGDPVLLIEVSTPQLEDGVLLKDELDRDISADYIDISKAELENFLMPKKKRGRKKKNA